MASIKATKSAAAEQAPTEQVEKRCACGCGAVVNPKRSFRPGHDARYKSALLNAYDAGDAEAGEELIARNWKSAEQLIERRDKAEAKVAAKAAKAEAAAAAKAEKEVK